MNKNLIRISLTACALIAIAGSQTVSAAPGVNELQNPGFEDFPTVGLGNHFGHDISPWVVLDAAGAAANVITVDGPGNGAGKFGQPVDDAVGATPAVPRNYLDIQNDANGVYQSFTTEFGGTLVFGGSFAALGNSKGNATFSLREGIGDQGPLVGQATDVFLSTKDSQNEGWKLHKSSATVEPNTTYSLVVELDNNMAFDEGFVELHCITPPCDMDAWYPFDRNGKDLILRKNAKPRGKPRRVDGKVAGALDASKGSMVVRHSPILDQGCGNFSIDLWIKYAPQSGVTEVIEKRRQASGATHGYLLYIVDNQYGFQLADGQHTNYNNTAVPAITDNEWHHLAVTVDRNNPQGLLFYIDGVAGPSHDPTGRQGSLDNPADTILGKANANVCLDEVEFFDRVLKESEIRALFEAGSAGKCKPKKRPRPR